MEPRQKDERRCETNKPHRFRIDKLEERIAPSVEAACDALHDAVADFHSSGQQIGLVKAIINSGACFPG
jgi:hypothetical protein